MINSSTEYYFEFATQALGDVQVTIDRDKTTIASDPAPPASPVQLDASDPALIDQFGEGGQEVVYSPLMRRGFTLRVVSPPPIMRERVFNAPPDLFSVNVWLKDGGNFSELYWTGYLVSDLWQDAPEYESSAVEIQARDGLFKLENTTVADFFAEKTKYSHIDILDELLKFTHTSNQSLNPYLISRLYSTEALVDSVTLPAESENVLYDRNADSAYDADTEAKSLLVDVLERHNLELYLDRGRWIARSIDAIDPNTGAVRGTVLSTSTGIEFNYGLPSAKPFPSIAYEGVDGLTREGIQPVSNVSAEFTFGDSNLVVNPDFENYLAYDDTFQKRIPYYWEFGRQQIINTNDVNQRRNNFWHTWREYNIDGSVFDHYIRRDASNGDEGTLMASDFPEDSAYYPSNQSDMPYVEQKGYHRIPSTDKAASFNFSFDVGADPDTNRMDNNYANLAIDQYEWGFAGPYKVTVKYEDEGTTYRLVQAWDVRTGTGPDGGPLDGNPIVARGYALEGDDVRIPIEKLTVPNSEEGVVAIKEGTKLVGRQSQDNDDLVKLEVTRDVKYGDEEMFADVKSDRVEKGARIGWYYWKKGTGVGIDPDTYPKPVAVSKNDTTTIEVKTPLHTSTGESVTGTGSIRFERKYVPQTAARAFTGELVLENIVIELQEDESPVDSENFVINSSEAGLSQSYGSPLAYGPIGKNPYQATSGNLTQEIGVPYGVTRVAGQHYVDVRGGFGLGQNIDRIDNLLVEQRIRRQSVPLDRYRYVSPVIKEPIEPNNIFEHDGDTFTVGYYRISYGSSTSEAEVEFDEYGVFDIPSRTVIGFAAPKSGVGDATTVNASVSVVNNPIDGVNNFLDLEDRPIGLYSSLIEPGTTLLDQTELINNVLGYEPLNKAGDTLEGDILMDGFDVLGAGRIQATDEIKVGTSSTYIKPTRIGVGVDPGPYTFRIRHEYENLQETFRIESDNGYANIFTNSLTSDQNPELHIQGKSSGSLYLTRDRGYHKGGIFWDNSSTSFGFTSVSAYDRQQFLWRESGNELMRLRPDGRLGINDVKPTTSLHVRPHSDGTIAQFDDQGGAPVHKFSEAGYTVEDAGQDWFEVNSGARFQEIRDGFLSVNTESGAVPLSVEQTPDGGWGGALSPDKDFYVVGTRNGDTSYVYDRNGNRTPIGTNGAEQPGQVWTRDSQYVLLTNGGSSLEVFSRATGWGSVSKAFPNGVGRTSALDFNDDETKLYAGGQAGSSNRIAIYDTTDIENISWIETVDMSFLGGTLIGGLRYRNGFVYTAQRQSTTVYKLDPTDWSIVDTFEMDNIGTRSGNRQPYDYIEFYKGALYVGDNGGVIYRIDPDTMTLINKTAAPVGAVRAFGFDNALNRVAIGHGGSRIVFLSTDLNPDSIRTLSSGRGANAFKVIADRSSLIGIYRNDYESGGGVIIEFDAYAFRADTAQILTRLNVGESTTRTFSAISDGQVPHQFLNNYTGTGDLNGTEGLRITSIADGTATIGDTKRDVGVTNTIESFRRGPGDAGAVSAIRAVARHGGTGKVKRLSSLILDARAKGDNGATPGIGETEMMSAITIERLGSTNGAVAPDAVRLINLADADIFGLGSLSSAQKWAIYDDTSLGWFNTGETQLGGVVRHPDATAFGVNRWWIKPNGEAYFEKLFADELSIDVFTSNLWQTKAGSDILAKAAADLAQDYDIDSFGQNLFLEEPIEDSPAANGRLAEDGDILRLRIIDRSGGGLNVVDQWVSVQSYVGSVDGVQEFQVAEEFVNNASEIDGTLTAPKGSTVVNYGQSGDTIIERSTTAAGAPFDRIVRWFSNADINANSSGGGAPNPNLSVLVSQLGNIGDVADVDPGTQGIYTESARFTGDIVVGDITQQGSYMKYDPAASLLTVVGAVRADSGLIGGWSINQQNLLKLNNGGDRIELSSAESLLKVQTGNYDGTVGVATFKGDLGNTAMNSTSYGFGIRSEGVDVFLADEDGLRMDEFVLGNTALERLHFVKTSGTPLAEFYYNDTDDALVLRSRGNLDSPTNPSSFQTPSEFRIEAPSPPGTNRSVFKLDADFFEIVSAEGSMKMSTTGVLEMKYVDRFAVTSDLNGTGSLVLEDNVLLQSNGYDVDIKALSNYIELTSLRLGMPLDPGTPTGGITPASGRCYIRVDTNSTEPRLIITTPNGTEHGFIPDYTA